MIIQTSMKSNETVKINKHLLHFFFLFIAHLTSNWKQLETKVIFLQILQAVNAKRNISF